MESRSKTSQGHKESRIWRLGLLLIGTLWLWRVVKYRGALIDDAYISLRYGRHLVEGLGLVFNVGERVEGYTNFLWVILGALFQALSIPPMAGLRCVSLAATLGCLVWAVRLIRHGGADSTLAHAASGVLILLLGVEAFAYYATTGMESMLFACLALTAFCLASRERGLWRTGGWGSGRLSVVLFVFLAMTRPEGVLIFALCHGVFLVVESLWHRGELRRRFRRSVVDGFGFALLFGLYFAWRWSYYGDLFPNTYYAKVTGGPEQLGNGLLALGAWAISHPLFVAAVVLTPGVLWMRRRQAEAPLMAALWGVAVCWLTYVVTIGGDFMPFFRFFLPVLAPLAVLTVWLAWQLPGGGRRQWAFLGLVTVQLVAGALDEEDLRAYVAHRTTVVGQQVGRFFAQELEPGALMAVNTVGSLPFESGLPTLDMLGLTDRAIARHPIYVISPRWAGHRRGWGEYVLRRKPQVVLWYNSAGATEPHYLGDHQLADQPLFRFFYQAKRQTLPRALDDDRNVLFPGAPFAADDAMPGGASTLSMTELGAEVEMFERLGWTWTRARPAPIDLHYFQLRQDLERFWSVAAEGDLDLFLDRVTSHWRQHPRAFVDGGGESARRVQVLCQQALAALKRGDRGQAKTLLSRAVEANGSVGSPLPYQYVTNLAYLEGNLFLAVQAQIEALRLEPQNMLYRNNLKSLLSKPYSDYRAEVGAATSDGGSVVSGAAPKQPASRQ